MSAEEEDEFEDRITKVVEQAITNRLHRLMVSVWFMIAGGVSSLVFLGVQWGGISTAVAANAESDTEHYHDEVLHMPEGKKYETFITRTEWSSILRERERDVDALRGDVARLNDKLDKLLEAIAGLRTAAVK
jgi:hypothetical protein